jgi:hypothetical protein
MIEHVFFAGTTRFAIFYDTFLDNFLDADRVVLTPETVFSPFLQCLAVCSASTAAASILSSKETTHSWSLFKLLDAEKSKFCQFENQF